MADDDRFLNGSGDVDPEQQSASYGFNTSAGPFNAAATLSGQEYGVPGLDTRLAANFPEGFSTTLSRSGQVGDVNAHARNAIEIAKQFDNNSRLGLEASRMGDNGPLSYGARLTGQIGRQGGPKHYYPEPQGHWQIGAGMSPGERHITGGAKFNFANGGHIDAALHMLRQHFEGGGLSDLFSGPDIMSTGNAPSPGDWGNPEIASDFFKADKAMRLAQQAQAQAQARDEDVTGSIPQPSRRAQIAAAPPAPAPEPSVNIPFAARERGMTLPDQQAPDQAPVFPYTGFNAVPPNFAMPSPVAPDLPAPRANPDVRPMAYAPATGAAQAPASQAIGAITSPLAIHDISDLSQFRGSAMGEPQGVVFHHTGGRGTPEGVINTLNNRRDPFTGRSMVLGTNYIIDRDGSIYAGLPPGTTGAHILPSRINNLTNANSIGVEVIANDNDDVTPEQIAAGQRLHATLSSGREQPLPVFGHGELNPGHKMPDEGLAIVNPIRMAQASTPSMQDAASSASTGEKFNNRAAAQPRMTDLTPQQTDYIIRTIAAESSGHPEESQGIANVIMNRINSGRFGATPEHVLFNKSQFEPWGNKALANYPLKIKPGSDKYNAAAAALDAALQGEDNTGGATFFWGPGSQYALGRKTPKWAKDYPDYTDIGATRFHREGRAGGGDVIAKALEALRGGTKVFPKPQRMFPEGARPPGGEYLNAATGEAMTGQKPARAVIGVTPEGKPVFLADPEQVEATGSPGPGSTKTKTNLFKQQAGWKWNQAPEGYENVPTIVSAENRGQHYYGLGADFPKGVDLERYANATSEPRLRPTTQGNVYPGKQVGSIDVRGREHPVYDMLTIRNMLAGTGAGAAGAAAMPDDADAADVADVAQHEAHGGHVDHALHMVRRHFDGSDGSFVAPADDASVPARSDEDRIKAYKDMAARVSQQSPDIQSMTHLGDKPTLPVTLDSGYAKGMELGRAPFDVAPGMSTLANTAYGAKTLPLYMNPVTALPAAASDFTESAMDKSLPGMAMSLAGAPGKLAKYGAGALMAAAGMEPGEAQAAKLPRLGGVIADVARAAPKAADMSLDQALEIARKYAGYEDPAANKIADWKWRPLSDVATDLNMTEIPPHVQAFGDYMKDMADKAGNQGLSARDLLKGYTTTRASIQRRATDADNLRRLGLNLPADVEKIRPEGAWMEWLGTPMGQKYLDEAAKGNISGDTVANAVKVMSPFGRHETDIPDAMRWAAQNIPGREAAASDLVHRAAQGASTPEEWRNFTSDIRGVGPSKSGFLASLYGRGDQPTLDARQIILNTGEPTKLASPFIARSGGQGGVEAVNRLAARQAALGLQAPSKYDPFYQHLAHHAIWDKASNEMTTHGDIIKGMQNYADGGHVEDALHMLRRHFDGSDGSYVDPMGNVAMPAIGEPSDGLVSSEQPGLVDRAMNFVSQLNPVGSAEAADLSKLKAFMPSFAPTGKAITRTGADLLAKDPYLAGNIPVLSNPKLKNAMPFEDMSVGYEKIPGFHEPYKPLSIEDLEGKWAVPLLSDTSSSGTIIHEIGGNKIDPFYTEGGGDFPRGPAGRGENPAGWASMHSKAGTYMNALNERIPEGQDVVGIHTTMGPAAADSADMFYQAMLRQMPHAKVTNAAIADVDKKMAKSFPGWPGIMNGQKAEEFMKSLPLTDRKMLAETLDMITPQGAGFPDVGQTRFAITEPRLFGSTGLRSGYSVSALDPRGGVLENPSYPHSNYTGSMAAPKTGGYLGGLPSSVHAKDIWQDWWNKLNPNAHDPNQWAKAQWGMMMQFPAQKIDAEMVDRVMKQQEEHKRIFGWRQGGEVSFEP